jgi:uncharacterized sulfatase
MEELYDTLADPHEVRNLAEDPSNEPTLMRMRGVLHRWMLEVHDLGFLPEDELRTRFGSKTPYEAVREEAASYPLEQLLAAAGAASLTSKLGEKTLPALQGFLREGDSAIRYWGAVGCVALGEKARPAADALRHALGDASPSVRIAAAEVLSRLSPGRGDPKETVPEELHVLEQALRDKSEWVRLQAANVLDRLGEGARPALDAMKTAAKDRNEYVRRVMEHALGVKAAK